MRMKTRLQTRKTFGCANHVFGVLRFWLVKGTSYDVLIAKEITKSVSDYESYNLEYIIQELSSKMQGQYQGIQL